MFYSTITNNDYEKYFATKDWLDGAWYDSSNLPAGGTKRLYAGKLANETWNWVGTGYITDPAALRSAYQKDRSKFEVLDPDGCIDAYAKTYLSDRRNVVLVSDHIVTGYRSSTNDSISKNSSLQYIDESSQVYELYNKYDRYGWLCDYGSLDDWDRNGGCSAARAKQQVAIGNFTYNSWPISGCVSEKVEEKCSVDFNLCIAIVVIVANVGKALCIATVCLFLTDQPLLTIGDAASSFLRIPDRTTQGCCLLNRFEIRTHWVRCHRAGTKPPPKTYRTHHGRRARAAGWTSWFIFLLL
jgi:hypothetical protein